MLEERAHKQINTAGVAIETIEALKIQNDKSSQQKASNSSEDIDEDWMNQFVRYAEDASSDRLQQLWGRILAGESKEPGAFSRQTLRFVAELDRETAENCELMAKYQLHFWILRSEDWSQGEKYMISIDLQRLGLIEGIGIGGPEQSFEIADNGFTIINGQKLGLLVKGQPGTKISIPIFVIIRVGLQVFSLLKLMNENESLREIVQEIKKLISNRLQLGR